MYKCVDPVLRRKRSSMLGLWIFLTRRSVLLESTFTLCSGLFLNIRPNLASPKWFSSKEIVKPCTMLFLLWKSASRTIYQKKCTSLLIFFPAPWFRMTNIWRKKIFDHFHLHFIFGFVIRFNVIWRIMYHFTIWERVEC